MNDRINDRISQDHYDAMLKNSKGKFKEIKDDIQSHFRIPGYLMEDPRILAEKNPLYKGSSKKIDTAFTQGFKAPGKNKDVISHALPKDGARATAYVPTTTSIEVAKQFPVMVEPGTKETYIYEIHSNRPTVNVAEAVKPKVAQGLVKPEDYRTIKNEKEKAFRDKIKPSEIKGCWKVTHVFGDPYDPVKHASLLQRYSLPHDISPEFIRYMNSSESVRIINKEFIRNPQYQYPGELPFKLVNAAGKVLTGVAIATDANSLHNEYQHSTMTNDYRNTYREGSRIVGGWACALPAGFEGAKAGAAACPGPLKPWCAFIGGAVGAGIGYIAGSLSAIKLFDAVNPKLDLSSTSNISMLMNTKPISLPAPGLNITSPSFKLNAAPPIVPLASNFNVGRQSFSLNAGVPTQDARQNNISLSLAKTPAFLPERKFGI